MTMHRFDALTRAGFTLIETLVAITILTLSIAAPLYVADRSVVSAQGSRDQLVASYLAQEGVEYVRMMRDHEFLSAYRSDPSTSNTAGWDNFLNGSGSGSIQNCRGTTCMLDPTLNMGAGSGLALAPCSGSSCKPLNLANGVYTLQSVSGAVQTPFTRTVQIFLISGNDVRVVSKVNWTSHGTPYSVSSIDHLTPWQ